MRQLIVGILAIGGMAAPAAAQDFSFRRDLPVGAHVWVRNVIGDVRIEGGAGRTLEVTARRKAGRHGRPEDVEIKAVEADGGVAICVYYPGSGEGRRRRDRDEGGDEGGRHGRRRVDPCNRDLNWGGNGKENDTAIDFVVRLPAGLAADIKTVSGDVAGTRLAGTLDIGTVSGNLELTDVRGEMLDAASVSGDVTLDQVEMREVSAETVSGNVTFVGPVGGKGAYDFKTLSGDVTVTLPRQPDAKMSAVTFSGDLRSDFPVTPSERRHRNRVTATWGAGTADLDLESFSGNIRIRSSR